MTGVQTCALPIYLEDFSASEIIQEANKKFGGTFVIVNGELTQLQSINDSVLYTYGKALAEDEVESFEPWMPKAGIYHSDINDFVYLYRLPRRQWLKSFAFDSNYRWIKLTKHFPSPTNIFSLENVPSNAVDDSRQWLFKDKNLIFKWLKVGEIVTNEWVDTIKVTEPIFYQEVFDKWHKQYKIILA